MDKFLENVLDRIGGAADQEPDMGTISLYGDKNKFQRVKELLSKRGTTPSKFVNAMFDELLKSESEG